MTASEPVMESPEVALTKTAIRFPMDHRSCNLRDRFSRSLRDVEHLLETLATGSRPTLGATPSFTDLTFGGLNGTFGSF